MTSTGDSWRLGHRPALDGLRAVAASLVVLCHITIALTSSATFAHFGHGVVVFFTLSGFLITVLLLEERARSGRINYLAFMGRRCRRLLPALVAYVSATVVLAAVVDRSLAPRGSAIAALLYFGNWPMAHGYDLGALSVTWTLAIEEQFYLLWPLVVIAVLRWTSERTLLAVALVGAAASVAASFVLWSSAGAERVYFGSDTRAAGLLVGCALAVVMRRTRLRPGAASRSAGVTMLVVFLASLGLLTEPHLVYLVVPLLVTLGTATLIAFAVSGRYVGWLASPVAVWLGRRSYGLYLWHYLVVQVVARLDLPAPIAVPLAVVVSIAAATVSHRFVEVPWVRRQSGQPRLDHRWIRA